MAENISRHPAQTISVVVERGGQRIPLTVTPDNEHGKGKIGVSLGAVPLLRRKFRVSAKES